MEENMKVSFLASKEMALEYINIQKGIENSSLFINQRLLFRRMEVK